MKQHGLFRFSVVCVSGLALLLLAYGWFVLPIRGGADAVWLAPPFTVASAQQGRASSPNAVPVPLPAQPISPLAFAPSPLVPSSTLSTLSTTSTLSMTLATLHIALVNENKLKFWQNGTLTLLTEAEQLTAVKISEDGLLIAFQTAEGLWTIQRDGSHKQLQVDLEKLKAETPAVKLLELLDFAWLPHSHILLFSTQANVAGINVDSGEKVFQSGYGSGRLLPSPNGQWIAVFAMNFIRVINPKDGTGRDLIDYPTIVIGNDAPSPSFIYPAVRWAADSQSLVAAIFPADSMYKNYLPTAVWRLTLDGRDPTFLTSFVTLSTGISFAPDLTKVLFFPTSYLFTEGTVAFELAVASLDHATDRTYLTTRGAVAIWLPDSQHFVFHQFGLEEYMVGQAGKPPTFFFASRKKIEEREWIDLNTLTWLDAQHFLYKAVQGQTYTLKLGVLGGPSIPLAELESNWINFDYTLTPTTVLAMPTQQQP